MKKSEQYVSLQHVVKQRFGLMKTHVGAHWALSRNLLHKVMIHLQCTPFDNGVGSEKDRSPLTVHAR